MTAYVDTSILAAYYCPEPLSASAQQEVRKLAPPIISALVEVELLSALALKIRHGEMDTASAGRVLSLFQAHRAANSYRVLPVEAREYSQARDWLSRFTTPLRTLDALHLATAFANGLRILTSDRGLAQAAGLLGVPFQLLQAP